MEPQVEDNEGHLEGGESGENSLKLVSEKWKDWRGKNNWSVKKKLNEIKVNFVRSLFFVYTSGKC